MISVRNGFRVTAIRSRPTIQFWPRPLIIQPVSSARCPRRRAGAARPHPMSFENRFAREQRDLVSSKVRLLIAAALPSRLCSVSIEARERISPTVGLPGSSSPNFMHVGALDLFGCMSAASGA